MFKDIQNLQKLEDFLASPEGQEDIARTIEEEGYIDLSALFDLPGIKPSSTQSISVLAPQTWLGRFGGQQIKVIVDETTYRTKDGGSNSSMDWTLGPAGSTESPDCSALG